MALESPMMPSDVSSSNQSFYHSESSTGSPADSPRSLTRHQPHRSVGSHSDSLNAPLPSPYPQFTDPSPVDSNGTASTEATEIEDDDDDNVDHDDDHDGSRPGQPADGRFKSPALGFGSPVSPEALPGLDTSLAARTRADSDAPQSVIHAPQNFKPFENRRASPDARRVPSTSPTESSSRTIVSPDSPHDPVGLRRSLQTSPLNTDVPPMIERVMATPHAKTREELENQWDDRKRRSSTSLEGIPEGADAEREEESEDYEDVPEERPTSASRVPEERLESVNSLKKALASAWDLCNNFSNLSSNHRNRIFNYRGKSEVQGQAWRSCWKLCQNLYECRDDPPEGKVVPTLELLRDFCQALFEARQKGDDAADSVLRVSFELNNHLYNTHDRNLPTAFQERTLDFYLTLCHRLMKQRTSLPMETDELLRACWQLAEMLFSIRQYKRDSKAVDEEVLASALQACWHLCDMFRDGWTQIMPNRSTPRASQTTFAHTQIPFSNHTNTNNNNNSNVTNINNANNGVNTNNSRSERSVSSMTRSSTSVSRSSSSVRSFKDSRMKVSNQAPPETPTTVFDDTIDTGEMLDEDPPNILVLGPEGSRASSTSSLHRHANPNKWSSAASGISESSIRTSSTATVSSSFVPVSRIRVLLVFVAKCNGWMPGQHLPYSSSTNLSSSSATMPSNQYSPSQQTSALIAFVKGMPTQDFGDAAWERDMLEKYKKLVMEWPVFASKWAKHGNGLLIQDGVRTITHAECARAVVWMTSTSGGGWMRELFRKFLGVSPDEAFRDTEGVISG